MSYNNLDSYFNINKFSLKDKYDEIYNKSIDECAYYAINSSDDYKGGFEYNGNNDKCYLYETQDMNYKLNNDDLNSYNIKTFFKVKSTIDLDNNQNQKDQYNYFKNINNKYYNINGMIDKVNVSNERECLQKCLDDPNNKCKSVIYLEQPKKCTFYENKDMNINKNDKINNEKIYTFKKNINKEKSIEDIKNNIVYNYKNNIPYNYKNNIEYNYKNMDKNMNITKVMDNPILYKCGGLDSTNPFCTNAYNPNNIENNELQYYTDCLDKQFENINDQEKYFTNECKNKYGNEYVFDNNYHNLDNIMNCENNIGKRGKCKINMYANNIIENFENNSNNCNGNCKIYKNERVLYEEYIDNKDLQKKRFILFLFLFIIIIIFVFYK